jgi:hypothetical protein
MPFSSYLPEHMGSITLWPPGPYVAGSHAELTLTYAAGKFGIDDTGMLKVSWRTTSDMSKPQFDKPSAPNFTTVEASNGARLEVCTAPPCSPARIERSSSVNCILVQFVPAKAPLPPLKGPQMDRGDR